MLKYIWIYIDVTRGPFNYLFINLTQECIEKFKYSSHLFDNLGRVNVYIVEGQRYRKEVGYGNFDAIAFKNNNEQMNLFTPHLQRLHNHVIYQPRLSNITHIGMPQTNFNNGQMEYEMKHIQPTRNITQNTYIPKVETEAVGVNTQTQDHKYMQNTFINLSTKYTNTQTPDMYRDSTSTQTQPMQHFEAGTNTNLANNRFSKTKPIQRFEASTNTNLPSNIFSQTQPMKVKIQ